MCKPSEITCYPEMWDIRITFTDGQRFSEYADDEPTKRAFDELLMWFCDPLQGEVRTLIYTGGRGIRAFTRRSIISIEIQKGQALIVEEP